MQYQRFLIQILAILALFSATQAVPSLEFDTSLLCTESYRLTIKYFDAVAGDQVIFAGGVSGTATRYVTYDVVTSGSGSFGTYIVYPGPTYTYFAQYRRSGNSLYQIDLDIAACTGLTTTGLPASKQAVWVADVYRKDTNPSATGYFWNSHLQTAATDLLTNTSACTALQSSYLSDRGYPASTSLCLLVTTSSADAGGLIQYIIDKNNVLQSKWGILDEVAFAQDTTNRVWIMILANRPRFECGNKYRSANIAGEGCDDGNNDNNDGCDSDCVVEPGWTCTESVLLEGSTCVQGPVPPMTPVAAPVASPTAAPQAGTPAAGTPTAAPTTTPTAAPSVTPTSGTPSGNTPTGSTPSATPSGSTPSATPSGSTPSATPHSSTPSGQTPSSQTPSGSTPSGQTPSGQTPSGQTPSSPSSPQGSTPSTSSGPGATPSGSESPSTNTPGTNSPSTSQSPDGTFTPSDVPTLTPSTSGPFSPRPSRAPGASGIVSGSEQITASVFMVIVTMLSVIVATF